MREYIYQKVFGDLIEKEKGKKEKEKEKKREYMKKYFKSEKGKKTRRRYYEKHRKEIIEWMKRYKEKNVVYKWEEMGKIVCPKCKKEGLSYKVTETYKTGRIYERMLVKHNSNGCWIKYEKPTLNLQKTAGLGR
jgi:hypothetical protein